MTEKLILEEKTMLRTLARLSHEIIEQNQNEEVLYLVGIRRRGVPLAKVLKENIEQFSDISVQTGELDISFYRDDTKKRFDEPRINESLIDFDVNDKNIILVDDVLYLYRENGQGRHRGADRARASRKDPASCHDRPRAPGTADLRELCRQKYSDFQK